MDRTYEEWERLTRFLESARLAFTREQQLWQTLGIREADRVSIAAPAAHGREYEVPLPLHLDALGNTQMLHASVLIHSYALAESAAARKLEADQRRFTGIEDWGGRLLAAVARDWTAVKGGLRGIVEVAVLRNELAHGSHTIDATAAKRLLAAGVANRPEKSAVSLSYQDLNVFRARLLSLLKAGGI